MIKYSLGCENEHEFEGWFGSSGEFDRLQKSALIDCPICGSVKVEKLLMAPSIPIKSNAKTISQSGSKIIENEPAVEGGSPLPASSITPPLVKSPESQAALANAPLPEMPPQLAEVHEEMLEKVREFKKHIVENSEDVGENFGEEARKIHYGEAKARGIYGQTSKDEAIELLEEGIDVVPIPDLPEENN